MKMKALMIRLQTLKPTHNNELNFFGSVDKSTSIENQKGKKSSKLKSLRFSRIKNMLPSIPTLDGLEEIIKDLEDQ